MIVTSGVSILIRAVPMGYLLWFLSILIILTAKQNADVALELIKRD